MVRGADGMTDSATANGDDRDPEIELFVKVGRHSRSSSLAEGDERSQVSGRRSLWDLRPSLGSAVQRPRGPAGGLSLRGSREKGVSTDLAGGCLLEELTAVYQTL